jgi:multiple sugar transport system permease protein
LRRPVGAIPTGWGATRRRAYLGGLLPALLLLSVITVGPALYLLSTSLTPLNLTMPGTAWDFSDPLANYRDLLTDERFGASVAAQIKLSVATVTLQLLIGLGMALLLNGGSRLMAIVRSGFLVPMVLPPIVVAVIWKLMYSPDVSPLHRTLATLGLPLKSLIADPSLALWAIAGAETWEWFPFTMLTVLAALQMVPAEPIEAAWIDGANRWQLFRYVLLPYLQPSLVVAGLFRLIDSIKAFPLIFVLTQGGPGTATEVTNYYGYEQAFNFSYWGYGSAIATLMVAGVFGLSWIVDQLGHNEGAGG